MSRAGRSIRLAFDSAPLRRESKEIVYAGKVFH